MNAEITEAMVRDAMLAVPYNEFATDDPYFAALAKHLIEALSANTVAPDDLRQKLRMIISHASGGHLSKPEDADRSTNDICVEISRHHNRIWEHAKEDAKPSEPTDYCGIVVMNDDAELVERMAKAIESVTGDPDKFTGTVSRTALRDARVAYAVVRERLVSKPAPAIYDICLSLKVGNISLEKAVEKLSSLKPADGLIAAAYEHAAKVADYAVERAERDWSDPEKQDAVKQVGREIAEVIRQYAAALSLPQAKGDAERIDALELALEPFALLAGDVNMNDPLGKWVTVGQLWDAKDALHRDTRRTYDKG